MSGLVAFIVISLIGFFLMLAGLIGLGYTTATRWTKVVLLAGALVFLSAWSALVMLDPRIG